MAPAVVGVMWSGMICSRWALYADWYALAGRRNEWVNAIAEAIAHRTQQSRDTADSYECPVCARSFCRPQDLHRHKSKAERSKPLPQQAGAIQCDQCDHWFASRGGLAVHKCNAAPVTPAPTPSSQLCSSPACVAHCSTCHRCFKSHPGYKRYNCHRGARPVDRSEYQHACPICSRKFRRSQDLALHKCKR